MGSVRRRLEQHPELLALGSEAVLYAVLGRMVDELSGELIRFSRATHPLAHGALGARRAAADRGQPAAERAGQEDLVVGGDHLRADAHRHRLRHELRHHARAARIRAGEHLVGDQVQVSLHQVGTAHGLLVGAHGVRDRHPACVAAGEQLCRGRGWGAETSRIPAVPGWGPPCGRRRDRCRCGRGRRPTGVAARPRLRPDPRRGRPGWVGRHRGAQGSAGGGARDADPWPPLCPSPGLSDGGGGGGAAVQSGSGRTGPGSLTRP